MGCQARQKQAAQPAVEKPRFRHTAALKKLKEWCIGSGKKETFFKGL